jgi:hypothetical protein
MCLYALREYRAWSQRLAHPALLPFARRICDLVSRNRLALSRFFLHASAGELSQALQALPPETCRTRGSKCE